MDFVGNLKSLSKSRNNFPIFSNKNHMTFSLFTKYMTFIGSDRINSIELKAAKKSVSGNSLKWRLRNDQGKCFSVSFSCHFKTENDCTNKSRQGTPGKLSATIVISYTGELYWFWITCRFVVFLHAEKMSQRVTTLKKSLKMNLKLFFDISWNKKAKLVEREMKLKNNH